MGRFSCRRQSELFLRLWGALLISTSKGQSSKSHGNPLPHSAGTCQLDCLSQPQCPALLLSSQWDKPAAQPPACTYLSFFAVFSLTETWMMMGKISILCRTQTLSSRMSRKAWTFFGGREK